MGKLISLRLKQGNLKEGFAVRLEIHSSDDNSGISQPVVAVEGGLPAFATLEKQYINWQKSYRNLALQGRLGSPPAQITHISKSQTQQQCLKQADTLKNSLLSLYNSEDFARVREKLLLELKQNEYIRILIQTDDIQLRKLPWHLFFSSFKEAYPYAEIALSPLEYGYLNLATTNHRNIKILAILGSNEGIDIETDREIIALLPNAEPHFLVSPTLEQFHHYLYNQPWDILFFAGHSSSQAQDNLGKLNINQDEFITIAQLTTAVSKAVQNGLRLAIFNSCDGLALANALLQLHLPQIIVMSEMVSDRIAQVFLKEFLRSFSGGQSLYMSVREAREKLQPLEKEYPCATWLPTIFQNPACLPLTWGNLHNLDFLPNINKQTPLNLPNSLTQIALFKTIGKATLSVEYQTLTQTQAEVLVSWDDTYVSMTSPHAAELLKLGGKVIKEEALRRIPVTLGKVAITTPGDLSAQHIFHAVVLEIENPQLTDVDLLQRLTGDCLKLADAYGVKSIAFPALVSDSINLTPEQSAVAMMIEIVKYLSAKTELEKVTIAIAPGKNIRSDLLTRFYHQVNHFLEMHQQMETRQDLLSDLLQIYHSRDQKPACDIILLYRRQLEAIKEEWTQQMLGVDMSECINIEYPLPELLPPVAPLPAPELAQSFSDQGAKLWDKLQTAQSEEEIRSLFATLEGDIDALAFLNDQFEVAIAATEAKAKAITGILQKQLEEYKNAQSILHSMLISQHKAGILPNKAQGKERKISFQAYPKIDVLVNAEELPPEYRTEKITYTANKKLLKEAIDKGMDLSHWASLDPNYKVKFSFKS